MKISAWRAGQQQSETQAGIWTKKAQQISQPKKQTVDWASSYF